SRETDLQAQLRAETAPMTMAMMQIPPEQGQFFSLLMQMLNVKKALEVGTFTGYSSLAMALALPDDAKLICCDINDEWTSVARRYWKAAGVDHKVELRLGPAAQTMQAMIANGEAGTFDFAFIDADKTGYDTYYELALQLTRPGGLIALDNMLMSGKVADDADHSESVAAVRALNHKLRDDPRVTFCLLPMADGIALALKR
ncbi:MAG: class I SAM-dependent methyltransferase, partial [Dehalococcoidia bacterium]|nr:class I SAM-dependent methyltransferase [Dehalococcoidia bacterium]